MLLLLLTLGHAATPGQVLERLAEVAPLRDSRLAEWAAPIDASDYERAAEGHVTTGVIAVEGEKARQAYGVGVLEVSIALLWAAINDDDGKARKTSLAYAELLSGEPCRTPRKVFQYLPVPVFTDRWWVSHFSHNVPLSEATGGRVREMTWDSRGVPETPTSPTAAEWAAQGIPVAWTKGAWWLVDLDGGSTWVEYQTWSDPGGKLPAGTVSRLSAGGISDTLQTIEELAKEGPGCPVE